VAGADGAELCPLQALDALLERLVRREVVGLRPGVADHYLHLSARQDRLDGQQRHAGLASQQEGDGAGGGELDAAADERGVGLRAAAQHLLVGFDAERVEVAVVAGGMGRRLRGVVHRMADDHRLERRRGRGRLPAAGRQRQGRHQRQKERFHPFFTSFQKSWTTWLNSSAAVRNRQWPLPSKTWVLACGIMPLRYSARRMPPISDEPPWRMMAGTVSWRSHCRRSSVTPMLRMP